MLHSGHNEVDGIPVEVVRKRIRRINIRVAADGTVCLSVPKWCYPPSVSEPRSGGYSGATLWQGEAFLREKWKWVLKVRAEVLARSAVTRTPVSEAELEALRDLLGELNDLWAARVGEKGVSWKIRKVKSLWGCCHWRDRYITYNADLARAPRELVEYVVVHEYTHFAVHNHGPRFYALMDERLPGWQTLRRRLNRREWDAEGCPAVGRRAFLKGVAAGSVVSFAGCGGAVQIVCESNRLKAARVEVDILSAPRPNPPVKVLPPVSA